jgi:hypothetical protein
MYTVSANSLKNQMMLLELTDSELGEQLQRESNPALLFYTEELLFKLEKDLFIRDSQLVNRDAELEKNIEIINLLYKSYRYRIGRFFIRPVEIVALKLGIMGHLRIYSKASHTSEKWNI